LDHVSGIVDGLVNLPPWLVLLMAFLLPAAEASIFIGVVLPGEVAIIVAGVLAHAHRLPLWLVILVGTVGAVAGDSVGYEVGARYGDRLLARLPDRLVKPHHIEQGRELLRRRGGLAVFIGRFAAALRALVPGLAGTSRLPYRVFLPFNFLGGLAWVTMSALIGYVAGASYKAAEHRLSLISGGVLAAIVVAIVYRVVRGSTRVQGWISRYGSKLPGLRLTAAVLALAGGGWLLGGLIQDVVAGSGVTDSDSRLLRDAVGHRHGWLTSVAKGVSSLGSWPVAYGLVVVLGAVVIWRARAWWLAGVSVALLGVGQGLQLAIGHAVGRSRPPHEFWLTDASGSGFPAGHPAMATIGFGLAGVLLLRLLPVARLVTVVVGLIVIVIAAAVGMAQGYLGIVWPSDVVGGWALGVTWLALAGTIVALIRLIRQRRTTTTTPTPTETTTETTTDNPTRTENPAETETPSTDETPTKNETPSTDEAPTKSETPATNGTPTRDETQARETARAETGPRA
jgi:membrane protein DedA with SNARE-associated domain/membrane-associated phospholipid phosphatase